MDTAEKHTPDFKVADATSYDAHVGDFERFTAVLTTPLAVRMIAMAGISAGQRVLDIGTGTGVVAIEAAKAAGPGGHCVGIDLSDPVTIVLVRRFAGAGVLDVVGPIGGAL